MNYNIFNEQNNLSIRLKDIIFKQQQFIDKQNLEIKKLKDENKKLMNQKNNQQSQQHQNETIINESLLEHVFNKCLEKNLQNLNLTSVSNYSSTDVHNIDSCLKPSHMKSINYTNSIDINNNNKDNEKELTKQSSMNLNLVMNELKERFGQ
tara:strand:+ start:965 stop:1417 length:453 start_codon:yes stop_codon:yes gene_type:complete